MEWIFSGIGTWVISFIAGGTVGGFVGYRIGISKNNVKQSQKAKNNAKQSQVSRSVIQRANDDETPHANITKNRLCQTQKAGNNVTQSQFGEIKHE